MAGPANTRSGVGKFFLGTPAETVQVDRYNPQQQDLINRSAGMASNMLGNASFDPYARQAREQFSQQTVPGLAERFTSMGGRGSSAFGQQLGNAAAGLESNLATGRADYDRNLLQQLLGTGLTQQFDAIYRPEQSGFLANTANAFGQALPRLGLAYMTGGMSELGELGQLAKILGIGKSENTTQENNLENITQGLSSGPNANTIYNQGSQKNPNIYNMIRLLSNPNNAQYSTPQSSMQSMNSAGAMQQQLPLSPIKSPQNFGNTSSVFGNQNQSQGAPALMQLLSALQNQQGSGIPWKTNPY